MKPPNSDLNIDTHLGSNLFLPGWSKTGRRTKPAAGKSLSDNERENLPPKKRNLELSESNRVRKQHVCDICARSFKSYQALGGHKAHHNNKGNNIKLTGENENDVLSTGFVHECPFCKKVFSKGQALGGHKRHCRRAENENPSFGGEMGKNKPRVLSFDLNDLPPEWIEEEMVNAKNES